MKGFLQLWAILDDPALDGRVIDRDTPLFHQLFDMTVAQGIRHIPAHTHEDDILREMGPLEADRHRRSPLLYTLDHRQRPYHKSPQMQICDKTRASATVRCGRPGSAP